MLLTPPLPQRFREQKKMGRTLSCVLCFICFFVPLCAADWNIMNQRSRNGMKISLKNYCESWRMNVELHNIRDFDVVPQECTYFIGKYVTSTQYKVDSETAIEECLVYLGTNCNLRKDGRDAWIFDIDDTLLSTVPYYKQHNFGGERLNVSSLEEWMRSAKAPALEHSLRLFNEFKIRGVQVILISQRRESLRSSTIDNLLQVGYHGWASLILRGSLDEGKRVAKFKSDAVKQLIKDGYRIWGIVGDQYSSFSALPNSIRAFKLPNPMYYVA